jgi:hypothetical protein
MAVGFMVKLEQLIWWIGFGLVDVYSKIDSCAEEITNYIYIIILDSGTAFKLYSCCFSLFEVSQFNLCTLLFAPK